MLILLDECVPHQLRRLLTGHNVRLIHEMGWAGRNIGQLLRLMAEQAMDVLVTVDQNLRYHQNPYRLGLAVVVLVAKTIRLKDLRSLIPQTLAVLKNFPRAKWLKFPRIDAGIDRASG